jgi:hypothetical protein
MDYMIRAIFIVGLPGSGKTHHLQKLEREFDALVFDDFKARALNDNPAFDHARRLPELVNGLRSGRVCIVADIDFCRKEARCEAKDYLEAAIPRIEIDWHFFANDLARCRQNVLKDKTSTKRNAAARLRQIERFSVLYQIPSNANVLQVRND